MTARSCSLPRFQRIGTVLSLSLFFAAASPALAGQAPRAAAPDPLAQLNESIDALTRKVWPSVVQILVTSYGPREDGAPGSASAVVGSQRSIGSGFVIDRGGLHHHERARGERRAAGSRSHCRSAMRTERSRRRCPPGRRSSRRKSSGPATELDLALLKVDGVKLPALPMATYSQLRQGEMVFAFGSPNGLRNSLTHGLVSSVARQVDSDSPLIFVQTDTPINPGNSGGPLVNIRGEVVGVNTFIMSQSGGNEGLGFAIPSATARTAFHQLKEYGHLRKQEIGMSIQTITPGMAASLGLSRDYGVIVSDVWPGGPALAGGLAVGDILVSVDGEPAENLPTVSYAFRLRDTPDNVQLVVLRGATQIALSIKPVEERSTFDSVSLMADPAKNLVPELSIVGVEIDARLAASATGLRDPYGIIVVARAAGGRDVPLQPRDIIRSVNNRRVATLTTLRDAVRTLTPGTPVTLQVQREGRLMYVSFIFD